MSKELSEETKYELNLFGRKLNKDLTNLMELLRKQDEDNKAILYTGKHIQKIILPYEEYQKMCKRLEAIDNAEPSEALECLEEMWELSCDSRKPEYILYETIKQALIQAQDQEKVLKIMFTKTVSIFQMSCCKNADEYNDLKFNDNEKLTKDEFDLLKRWLG